MVPFGCKDLQVVCLQDNFWLWQRRIKFQGMDNSECYVQVNKVRQPDTIRPINEAIEQLLYIRLMPYNEAGIFVAVSPARSHGGVACALDRLAGISCCSTCVSVLLVHYC